MAKSYFPQSGLKELVQPRAAVPSGKAAAQDERKTWPPEKSFSERVLHVRPGISRTLLLLTGSLLRYATLY